MADMGVTVATMVDRIQDFLGWSSPTAPQSAQALEWLVDGYRDMSQGVHPFTGVQHNWSWLDPKYTLSLADGTETYDLPNDFADIISVEYAPVSGYDFPTLRRVSIQEFDAWREIEETANETEPQIYTIEKKTFQSSVGQRSQIRFLHIPDEARNVYVRYRKLADTLTDAAIYAMGGAEFAGCLQEAGLAMAEMGKNTINGPHYNEYKRLLAQCISLDMQAGCYIRRENHLRSSRISL